MSVFSHASVTLINGTAFVSLTFISNKVAEQYATLSNKEWKHERPTDRHVTRIASGYAGFRAYRDAFCLVFQTINAADLWLYGQQNPLWTIDDREPDEVEVKGTCVSLRNGITYQDLGMRNNGAIKVGNRENGSKMVTKERSASESESDSGRRRRERASRRQYDSDSSSDSVSEARKWRRPLRVVVESKRRRLRPDTEFDANFERIEREEQERNEWADGSKGKGKEEVIETSDAYLDSEGNKRNKHNLRMILRRDSDSDQFYSLPGSDIFPEVDMKRRGRSRSRSRSPGNRKENKHVSFFTSNSGLDARRPVSYPNGSSVRMISYDAEESDDPGVDRRKKRDRRPDPRFSYYIEAVDDRRDGSRQMERHLCRRMIPPPGRAPVWERRQPWEGYGERTRIAAREEVVYHVRERSSSRSSIFDSGMAKREIGSHARSGRLVGNSVDTDSNSETTTEANSRPRRRVSLRSRFSALIGKGKNKTRHSSGR